MYSRMQREIVKENVGPMWINASDIESDFVIDKKSKDKLEIFPEAPPEGVGNTFLWTNNRI